MMILASHNAQSKPKRVDLSKGGHTSTTREMTNLKKPQKLTRTPNFRKLGSGVVMVQVLTGGIALTPFWKLWNFNF